MTRIRRRYLILHGLRWLPSGLLIPVMVLLMLERGIGLSQIGLIFAIQGFVVLGLELPTGGLADALGRKPVLVAAAAFSLASLAMFAVAQTVWMFVVALLLQGIYRALESGPLDAWFVDAALAADPKADLEGGLSAAGVVTGVSIASGALLAGGLVALGPMGGVSALTVPVIVAVALSAVNLAALAWLLVEDRPGRGVRAVRESVRAVPGTIGSAVRLVRRSRIVLALICVEIFWGFGMVTFETLLPVRLSDVVGSPDTAAALLGPAGSAAWLASAGGAALAPVVARRIGVPLTAGLLRILQGATVVAMGLLAGPVGVLTAFLICYIIHGASNPLHMALLHRQVDGPYRTTIVSLNSMMGQPAAAVGAIALTALAAATSVSTAMVVGAVVLALAAPLYIPARKTVMPVDDVEPVAQGPDIPGQATSSEVRGIEPVNPNPR
jgi:MFS family permease